MVDALAPALTLGLSGPLGTALLTITKAKRIGVLRPGLIVLCFASKSSHLNGCLNQSANQSIVLDEASAPW